MKKNGEIKIGAVYHVCWQTLEQVFDSYEKNGYRAVDQLMMKKISKKQWIKSKIQTLVPLELRIRIKNSK